MPHFSKKRKKGRKRPRHKMATKDWQPNDNSKRFSLAPSSKIVTGRVTGHIVPVNDPKHEGMHDAQMDGYRKGKGYITRIAKNGSPSFNEVASDRRTQAAELERERFNAQMTLYYRKRGEI